MQFEQHWELYLEIWHWVWYLHAEHIFDDEARVRILNSKLQKIFFSLGIDGNKLITC